MGNFNDSLHVSKIDLWFIVDTMNGMFLDGEWLSIFFLKNKSAYGLGLPVFIVFTLINQFFT